MTTREEKFTALLDELERWNQKVNLTAIRDRGEMVTAHIDDSLAAQPLLRGGRILDVGTGAGFPGLPLAIVEPQREFHLIDSNNKKIMFVQHVAGLLGLDNVTAAKTRAEDYDRDCPGSGRIAEACGDRRTPRRRGRGVCSAQRALPGRRTKTFAQYVAQQRSGTQSAGTRGGFTACRVT